MTNPALPSAMVSETTSRRMSLQRTRDTAPELQLRRKLHRKGMRYRVDAPLPGLPRRRADILYTQAKVAVFVDGCFWHSCPEHGTTPATNQPWWIAKLERNAARDRDTSARLLSLGWTPLRVWEHEDMDAVSSRIEQMVRPSTRLPVQQLMTDAGSMIARRSS